MSDHGHTNRRNDDRTLQSEPDRAGETQPDPDAPGNYVDDEDAPEVPEPNEPA